MDNVSGAGPRLDREVAGGGVGWSEKAGRIVGSAWNVAGEIAPFVPARKIFAGSAERAVARIKNATRVEVILQSDGETVDDLAAVSSNSTGVVFLLS